MHSLATKPPNAGDKARVHLAPVKLQLCGDLGSIIVLPCSIAA